MDSNDIRLDENDEIAREILQQTQYWTVNDEDPGIVDNDNAYLRTLTQNSSLKLLQESKIRRWGIHGHDIEYTKGITQGYEQKV